VRKGGRERLVLSGERAGVGSRPGRLAPLPWVCGCPPLRGLRHRAKQISAGGRPPVPDIVSPVKITSRALTAFASFGRRKRRSW